MSYREIFKKSSEIPLELRVAFYDAINPDELAKSRFEAPRWLDKKFDIRGVVFLAGIQQYM